MHFVAVQAQFVVFAELDVIWQEDISNITTVQRAIAAAILRPPRPDGSIGLA